MTWRILTTPEFNEWFDTQILENQAPILASLRYLGESGPSLGRPRVDTLKGTKLTNLKELRVPIKGRPLRVFFAFDSKRRVIVLCAGDKTGDKRFYARMIPLAEILFERHEAELSEFKPRDNS